MSKLTELLTYVPGDSKGGHIYEIRLLREIWNGVLHIVIGAILVYVFIPNASLIGANILGMFAGGIREFLQWKRSKWQPIYIHILDTLGFMIGASLWVLIRTIFNINADML